MTRLPGHLMLSLLFLLCMTAHGQTYRTSFEEGDKTPKGWTCDPKDCNWVSYQAHTGKRSVCVVGTATTSVAWRSADVKFEPGAFYRMTFYYRVDRTGEKGCSTTGAGFAYWDFQPTAQWEQGELIFQAPHEEYSTHLRLAHWQLPGSVYFDDVVLERIGMAYQKKDGVVLGRDEKIEKGEYHFKADLRSMYTNCFRVIDRQKLTYHSGWWEFRDDTYLVLCFRVDGHRQQSGRIKFLIAKFLKGTGTISISKDKQTWREIGRLATLTERAEHEFDLPSELFPAEEIYVRIGVEGPTSFNLNTFDYTAKLDGSPHDLVGSSRWFRGHYIVADTGALRLVFEEGWPELVQIWQGQREIGSLRFALAQFEKEGLGYKGSGIGLADSTAVKQIIVKEKTPERCVVNIVIERSESAETKRCFEATVRIEAQAGQCWLRCSLASVKNTDKAAYDVRGYCHLVQPGDAKKTTPVNFPACAGWLLDNLHLGCACVGEDVFTFSFRQKDGAPHGEVCRLLRGRLPPGEMRDAQEPAVVVWLGSGDAKALTREGDRMRRVLDPSAKGDVSGQMRYEEEGANEN
ncbi:MAG: hypothetical protein AB1696_13750 [Planctomycetota bacterium]